MSRPPENFHIWGLGDENRPGACGAGGWGRGGSHRLANLRRRQPPRPPQTPEPRYEVADMIDLPKMLLAALLGFPQYIPEAVGR